MLLGLLIIWEPQSSLPLHHCTVAPNWINKAHPSRGSRRCSSSRAMAASTWVMVGSVLPSLINLRVSYFISYLLPLCICSWLYFEFLSCCFDTTFVVWIRRACSSIGCFGWGKKSPCPMSCCRGGRLVLGSTDLLKFLGLDLFPHNDFLDSEEFFWIKVPSYVDSEECLWLLRGFSSQLCRIRLTHMRSGNFRISQVARCSVLE
jgi:hypothetical protein